MTDIKWERNMRVEPAASLYREPLNSMPVTDANCSVSILMTESYSAREELLFIKHLGYASLCPKAISFSLPHVFVPCIKELTIVA